VLPAPWLIALAFVVGLLVLIPARRLQLADIPPRVIGLYALGLWILAMVLAIRPAGARILIPFLLVAYLAPFVAAPDAVRRLVTRGRGGDGRSDGPGVGRPPMKDVTPPDDGADP
jgi:hypothetical protein